MKKYLSLIVLIAVFVSGCLQIETDDVSGHTVFQQTSSRPATPETVSPETPEEPAETTEPDVTIILGAVGDIIASSENFQTIKTGDVYQFAGQFKELSDSFSNQDYTVANLISPIAGEDFGYGGYPRYNAPNELVQALADIGIDALSTSNRYAYDLGIRAVVSNLFNIREIGLTPYGTAGSQEESDELTIVDVKGIKLGLLSYTTILNQPLGNNPFAVSLADRLTMATDIERLRENGAEIIIVHMYWGDEYADMPNAEQQELMSYLASMGVDVVLGAHPHVIQPLKIEQISWDGQIKPMVQAYSLGSFYSAFLMSRTKTGLLLEIDISRISGRAVVADVRHRLTYNHQTELSDGTVEYRLIELDSLEERRNDALYQEMKTERDRVEDLLRSLDE